MNNRNDRLFITQYVVGCLGETESRVSGNFGFKPSRIFTYVYRMPYSHPGIGGSQICKVQKWIIAFYCSQCSTSTPPWQPCADKHEYLNPGTATSEALEAGVPLEIKRYMDDDEDFFGNSETSKFSQSRYSAMMI